MTNKPGSHTRVSVGARRTRQCGHGGLPAKGRAQAEGTGRQRLCTYSDVDSDPACSAPCRPGDGAWHTSCAQARASVWPLCVTSVWPLHAFVCVCVGKRVEFMCKMTGRLEGMICSDWDIQYCNFSNNSHCYMYQWLYDYIHSFLMVQIWGLQISEAMISCVRKGLDGAAMEPRAFGMRRCSLGRRASASANLSARSRVPSACWWGGHALLHWGAIALCC